jgi:hypothetical protein
MRSRNVLMGWCKGWEVIRGSSLELKVAEPSMLGTDAPTITPYRSDLFENIWIMTHPLSCESGSVHGYRADLALLANDAFAS